MQQASSGKLLGCMPRIQYKDAPRNLEVSNRCVGKTPSMQLVTWPRSSVTKRKSSCMAQVKRRTKRIAALALLAAVPRFCRRSSRVSRLQKCIKCNWHGVWLYMVRSYRPLSSTIWLLPQEKKGESMMSFKFQNILPKLQHITHLYTFNIWNHALNHYLPPLFHRDIFGTTKVPSEKHRCQFRRATAADATHPGNWPLNCPLGHAPWCWSQNAANDSGLMDVDPL